MSRVSVKKDDVGVLFSDTLTATGVNFSGVSSAKFLMLGNGGTAVSKTATTANPTTGSVDISYTTVSGDLAVSDIYRQEWELTFSGGNVLTFPSTDYNQVQVVDDLN